MADTILRIYDPEECDKHGVPLDWERCRTCKGRGKTTGNGRPWRPLGPVEDCPTCHGHGSLKAAALAARGTYNAHRPYDEPTFPCEGCGHSMSDGTWERTHGVALQIFPSYEGSLATALVKLRHGREPGNTMLQTHYSRCDEGCKHGGPFRCKREEGDEWTFAPDPVRLAADRRLIEVYFEVQASWRPVDVHTLGWAHDLRPEKLAILCLRCYAERKPPKTLPGPVV